MKRLFYQYQILKLNQFRNHPKDDYLNRFELKVAKVESVETDSYPPGRVIRTFPEANIPVSRNTGIRIIISMGTEKEGYPMPNIFGRNIREVEKPLQDIGLIIGNIKYIQTENGEEGEIILQTPQPDVLVSPQQFQIQLVIIMKKKIINISIKVVNIKTKVHMNKYLILLIILPLVLNACQGGEQKKMEENKEGALSEKKILMVIASRDFRDEEFQEPYSLFLKEGAKVVVSSSDTNEALGMLGMKIKPDKLIEDVNPLDFDAIVLVGGSGSTALWNNEKLHEHLRSSYKNGKVIGAICLSPVTLVKAGILEGKAVTCYETPEVIKIFKENNVELTGKSVNVIDNIVTANGPAAAKGYAEKIVELLK